MTNCGGSIAVLEARAERGRASPEPWADGMTETHVLSMQTGPHPAIDPPERGGYWEHSDPHSAVRPGFCLL